MAMTRSQLGNCVRFAQFAHEHCIAPGALAELIELAYKAFRAGERHANKGTEASDRAQDRAYERFADKAAALGFSVDWPGLWPRLQRDGRDVNFQF